jgi:hypothetical protein
MDKDLAEKLAPIVLNEIQDAYLNGKILKTKDCVDDMLRDGLYEADVEKLIMEAEGIAKAMPATSVIASNPKNTHYVIHGESTKCVKVYCKVCTNYHPTTNLFLGWRLTSFCIARKE